MDLAIASGTNSFDTADAYASGQSEVMLGELLGKRHPDVVLATRVGVRTADAVTEVRLSQQHLLAACDRSLKQLNTDCIDRYNLLIG